MSTLQSDSSPRAGLPPNSITPNSTELTLGLGLGLTKQSKQGPTDLVEGYWKGDVKEAHDEYVKEANRLVQQMFVEHARGAEHLIVTTPRAQQDLGAM